MLMAVKFIVQATNTPTAASAEADTLPTACRAIGGARAASEDLAVG